MVRTRPNKLRSKAGLPVALRKQKEKGLARLSSLLPFGLRGSIHRRFPFRDRSRFLGEALLQSFHQINHRSFGLCMRHRRDFPAAALGLNQTLQTSLVGIVVLVGLERGSQTLDELLSERALLVFYLALIGVPVISLGANFIRIEHGVES